MMPFSVLPGAPGCSMAWLSTKAASFKEHELKTTLPQGPPGPKQAPSHPFSLPEVSLAAPLAPAASGHFPLH